jgi:hypothetical protein
MKMIDTFSAHKYGVRFCFAEETIELTVEDKEGFRSVSLFTVEQAKEVTLSLFHRIREAEASQILNGKNNDHEDDAA